MRVHHAKTYLDWLAFLLIFACNLKPAAAHAQASALAIHETFEQHQLRDRDLEYLEDQSLHLTWEQVSAMDGWQPVRTEIPNFGYTESAYWFRFALKNPSEKGFQGVVELQYPILDWVQFVVLKDGKVVKQSQSGDMLKFSTREVQHHHPALLFSLAPSESALIYIRVQTESSMQVPIKVWDERAFWSKSQLPFAIQTLYFGVMLAMIVYNLFIYLSHKSFSYLLYVGFVSVYTLFQLSLQGLGMEFLWPENPEWNRVCLPLTTSLSLFFGALFSLNFLNIRDKSRILHVLLTVASLTAGLISLSAFFLPSSIVVRAGLSLSIPIACLCILAGLHAWRGGNPLGFYFTLAWTSLLLGTILAALNKFGALERNLLTEYTQQIGSYLEVTLLSFALGYRLNLISKEKYQAQREVLEAQEALYKTQKEANQALMEKNQQIQDINHNLEKIVSFRTRELKTIFDNIPQGVASLNENGVISQNYSRHLELVWDQRQLTGCSVFDFLKRSTLTADATDRIKQSLKACIGEDQLSFQINSGNFPTELTVQAAEKTFHYALTWSPELTEDGIVTSVLVTIEDVSARMQLQEESERRRKDMQIIQELLSCDAEKVAIFAGASETLLAENIRLTEAGALSSDDIKIMFVNAHTVKGGARALSFSILANALHDLEHEYAAILRGEKAADQDRMRTLVQEAWRVFHIYMNTNRDQLGRKMDTDHVSLELNFAREHYEALDALLQYRGSAPLDVLENIRRAHEILGRLIFKSDTSILEQCLESAGKIATDLGKPAPIIKLETGDIQVSRKTEILLRNILIHILRNALDHGIETPEERVSSGKAEAGTIAIRSSQEGGNLVLEIEDDGRGLAIDKLREKGLQRGIIGVHADPKEIADTIFIPGVSTAGTVSQISGRGVGMDAVRTFIEEVGGSIDLQLKAPQGVHIPFTFRITLPLLRQTGSEHNPLAS